MHGHLPIKNYHKQHPAGAHTASHCPSPRLSPDMQKNTDDAFLLRHLLLRSGPADALRLMAPELLSIAVPQACLTDPSLIADFAPEPRVVPCETMALWSDTFLVLDCHDRSVRVQ